MRLFVAMLIGVPLAYLAAYLTYDVTGDGGLSLLSVVLVCAVVGIVAAEVEYRRTRRHW